MRKFIFLFVVTLFLTNCNGQNKLEGKAFRTKTRETCKYNIGTLVYYKNFEFQKGKVLIYDNVVANVSKDREHTYDFLNDDKKITTYNWRIVGNEIIIKDFKDFDKLIYKDEIIHAYTKGVEYKFFPFKK